jgi:hypothetical protein
MKNLGFKNFLQYDMIVKGRLFGWGESEEVGDRAGNIIELHYMYG